MMSQSAESPAPQGAEDAEYVELPEPASQSAEEVRARDDEPGPNLDERQAAVRTERRAAGPDADDGEEREALEEIQPEESNESPTDPAEDSLE